MAEKYYFDTSIWLDFFEDRDEPNFPKSQLVHDLLKKVVNNNDKIIYSDNNIIELNQAGYSEFEINNMFNPLKPFLIFVEATEKQVSRAKDLSLKRKIPKRDALHALIARNNKAIMVTFDKHFQKILDIIKPKKPSELI